MNAKKQRTNCREGTVERSESIPPPAPLYLQVARIKVRLENSIDSESWKNDKIEFGVFDPPSSECAPQVFTQKGLMMVQIF